MELQKKIINPEMQDRNVTTLSSIHTMAPPSNTSATRAKRLAKLASSKAPDYDPEDDFAPHNADDSDSQSGDDSANERAREHYGKTNKSKLRKPDEISLGLKYTGSAVSRRDLEDDEEDDSLEDMDEDDMDAEDMSLIDDEASVSDDEDQEEDEDEDADDLEDDNESMTSQSSDPDQSAASDSDDSTPQPADDAKDSASRATLQNLMSSSSRNLSSSLATALASDASKGRAVKRQRTAFNSLLNCRIRLQQSLISVNTLQAETAAPDPSAPAHEAALTSALQLWDALSSLRDSLPAHSASSTSPHGTKRKRPSPPSSLVEKYTYLRAANTSSLPHRRSILAKWSAKTAPAHATAPRLNEAAHKQTSVLDSVDTQLKDLPALVEKSRVPRSCAPLQAQMGATEEKARRLDKNAPAGPSNGYAEGDDDDDEDMHADSTTNDTRQSSNDRTFQIYDDSPLYTTLLSTLLAEHSAAQMTDSATQSTDLNAQLSLARRIKSKRPGLDTKASKGRKMRYVTHEKLVNFMAPEDRNTWGERQRVELFRGLFGGVGRELAEDGAQVGEAEVVVGGAVDDGVGRLRLF